MSDDPGDYIMPTETLMQRMEADGRLWKLGYAEGFREGQSHRDRAVAEAWERGLIQGRAASIDGVDLDLIDNPYRKGADQ